MAGASDKARFFLEQSIPELKEWEKKNIFSHEEISSITIRRSDFEHKVNARGSTPSDYARYAEFEINVDTLRKKRVKRLGVRSVAHTGQRRIFFLFDRATKRFPGDLALWMQYLEYARRQRALKKLTEILTSALRLHPQRPDLWIYGAQFALQENGDMTEARSYMQRGLRFCRTSRNLWTEYTKLELLYISKIAARRQILGLDMETESQQKAEDQGESEGFAANVISLPRLTEEDINPSSGNISDIDESALRKFEQSPVLSGAIPIAIFDAAMNQFDHDESMAASTFNLVNEFPQLGCQAYILSHIVDDMLEHRTTAWQTMACHIKASIAGLQTTSPDFPAALGLAINRIRDYTSRASEMSSLVNDLQSWLESLFRDENLDPALKKVIESMKTKLSTRAAAEK
ncbi:putative rrna processing protein utp6 [Phaeomoniella chlamydospora]|uniref:Putative rrna processing protein utp6 n=1 Tax=Phaeomoniella chlamydospora TaxID=158046 RepID=A0A0G2HIF5_PHACM|nr:putative rrna processing protein utp6 [Phaeomoniella chlamydospora]